MSKILLVKVSEYTSKDDMDELARLFQSSMDTEPSVLVVTEKVKDVSIIDLDSNQIIGVRVIDESKKTSSTVEFDGPEPTKEQIDQLAEKFKNG